MDQKIRIEGIYDERTLKHLKSMGLKVFSFDFSPRSFNFLQEHIFLDQILPVLDPDDQIFLHFSRSNDPMINKLAQDIKSRGRKLEYVYFECDEWSDDKRPIDFSFHYVLKYKKETDNKMITPNFKGFIFEFSDLESFNSRGLIQSFVTNFYTRFAPKLTDEHFMILQTDWDQNLLKSVTDLFEFNTISLSINSKIEICYRNVDFKKLNNEMVFIRKNVQANLDF